MSTVEFLTKWQPMEHDWAETFQEDLDSLIATLRENWHQDSLLETTKKDWLHE